MSGWPAGAGPIPSFLKMRCTRRGGADFANTTRWARLGSFHQNKGAFVYFSTTSWVRFAILEERGSGFGRVRARPRGGDAGRRRRGLVRVLIELPCPWNSIEAEGVRNVCGASDDVSGIVGGGKL